VPARPITLAAGLLLAVLLASGCSPRVVLVDHPPGPWVAHARKLQAIRGWQIKARMAVRSKRKGGQATVHWKRANNHHDLDLYGAFGSGRLRMQQDADQATLIDSKNHHYTGQSLQQLLYQHVGWQVPFSSLQYWIVGLSAPGKTQQQQWDKQGRLRNLQQDGWRIQFSEYHRIDGQDLPRRLQLDALPGTIPGLAGDPSWQEDQPGVLEQPLFRIKLVIRSWQLALTTTSGASKP